ncbi:MAG: hypothetical protein D6723_16375 [Acidobacteria bacterium]|nr:MAG: hypothetical protein D6723_16375 [Acidobacteriota bacterium]
MIGQQGIDVAALRKQFFGDIPIDIEPNDFVKRLDVRISEILEGWVDEYLTSGALESPEAQLHLVYLSGWGELRSVDTFARQIEKMGYAVDYPELKLGVCRQLHDEMRHFKLYRSLALKMGGEDLLAQQPHPSFTYQFDYCDQVSEDPLELVFNCQFCCEKWAVPLFTNLAKKAYTNKSLSRLLTEEILPDEYFHIANGRLAARLLAKRGEEQRDRMLDIAAAMMGVNQKAIQMGSMSAI